MLTSAEEADARSPFCDDVGISCPLDMVKEHLPTHILLPFDLRTLVFSDRLGLFLTDGKREGTGAYPPPDDGHITVFSKATLRGSDGRPFRLTVKKEHYKKPRYPFVEIATPGIPWYGRVWLLFSCTFQEVQYNLALVSYLSNSPANRGNTTKRGFVWSSHHVECVELGLIRRQIVMHPSFTNRPGTAERRKLYHRIDSL